jgi:hypothetical protein
MKKKYPYILPSTVWKLQKKYPRLSPSLQMGRREEEHAHLEKT